MKKKYIMIKFAIAIIGLILMVFVCTTIGTIQVSFLDLINGLITGTNKDVNIIRDVRLPRIFISIFTGASLATSGLLLQSVMRNPLVDPGIIGISAGASLFMTGVITFIPGLFFYATGFGIIGGFAACAIVYFLALKGHTLSPLRIILAGIAVNAMFEGLAKVLTYMSGTKNMMMSSLASASTTGKQWSDVIFIIILSMIGLVLAFLQYRNCNILSLGDKNAKALGVKVNQQRIMITVIAVLLAVVPTSEVGIIGFVGLVVPHLSRIIVGKEHKILIPFTALLGGLMLVIADFLGRIIAYPVEIPIDIVMAIIGAPFFLYMLKRSDKVHAS